MKSSLSNHIGIFNLPKIRSILDKLLYSDSYKTIDQNLSYSNIGGRKSRNIGDHLFVIYGIINDVINGNAQPIDIQSMDIIKCFDKMSYYETNNDLWDAGLKSDKFYLLSELDKKCKVVVKTPCGDTKSFNLRNVIMQGSVFGSLKCCIQIDSLGRDCLSEEEGSCLYKYKNIDIMSLSFIDDILGISLCSSDSIVLNATINAKIESKKMRFSDEKCSKMHVSKKQTVCCSNLKVHNSEMKNVTKIKYLGDILNQSGNINDTINDRYSKGMGIITQISSLLSSISLGMYYFDIAMILRDSMLLNSILVSCHSWYLVSKKHIESLESLDILYMKKCFNSHSKTVRENYYLETGKIKMRYILSKRRLMYLHHILTRDKSELIFKVYQAQGLKPTKGVWFTMIQNEKIKYNIKLSDDKIAQMSKRSFKKIVDKYVEQVAYSELLNCQKSKSRKIITSISMNNKTGLSM